MTHPSVFGWYRFISNFDDKVKATWPKAELKVAAPAKGAAQAPAKGGEKKKEKKRVIAMSLVMLEVKPLDDQINLDDLAKRIFKEINQDGLFWKTEYKKEPVAFTIFKLIIGF